MAKSAGLYTNYVTNGYITPEALDLMGPYLDIFRVDIKAFSSNVYQKISNISRWEGILDIVQRAKQKWHIHVEIVTNVIPGLNDDMGQMRSLAQWIKDTLGTDTPWHITRFYPHWRMNYLPATAVKILEKIYEIAKVEGLNFVYIGNVAGHPSNQTYCPGCGEILIGRRDWEMVSCIIKENKCPNCGKQIAGRFE